MQPERWRKIEEIFDAAIDLPPSERSSFLDEACQNDEELRREIGKLIEQDEKASGLMSRPVIEDSAIIVFADFDESDPLIGRRIGKYEIKSELGHGGMGAVYRAERIDGEFRRFVAIKLIKRGMDTKFILRRFRQERQILAALNHPYIAGLLDGGTTEDGLPYFVMDFIEGETLYKYSDRRKLSIEERLKLFGKICEAVTYAHSKKVIHRDLKPSNVLIKTDGTPKLLDFGIAKVLNSEVSAITVDPTLTSMRMMTPEYASPEQIKGETVTVASDIYSLGVLLYELLTGHRPYHFKNRAPHEIARVICEQEPENPGIVVSSEDNLVSTGEILTIKDVFRSRGLSGLDDLRRQLAGDLGKIILKALRKNPAGRYQSVEEFAADISRFLAGKPISASLYSAETQISNQKSAAPLKTIAVLPLKILDLSGESSESNGFLSIGLADTLITRLSNLRRFNVRPTSSILQYENRTEDPFSVGKTLDVDYVLDGNLRRIGENIRVTVQLLKIADKTIVWANQFNEEFTDAIKLEEIISMQVAEAIVPQLTGEERKFLARRGTENKQAHEAYLRGRYFWNQFTGESLQKAIKEFENAISLDPNYALPYVGIADFYNWISIVGVLPSGECLLKAKESAQKALALDDSLGEAYVALFFPTLCYDLDWEKAKNLALRAIELNPNYSYAYEAYSYVLTPTGCFEEGIEAVRRAEELEPLSPRAVLMTSWTYYQSRRFAEALAKAESTLNLDKHFAQGYMHYGNSLQHLERAEEGVAALRKCVSLMPEAPIPIYILCHALVAANQRNEAQMLFDELNDLAAKQYVKPYFMAMSCVALGKFDEAFEWFEKGLEERDQWFIWLGTDPKLDEFRKDSRFPALFQKTKNPLANKFS
ncbi:MAG TPA: protein kinase [Pyrinomonadaceae bacterium]|jgi:serine/threonine protein kinase/Tfp pilus assembly protein PilF